MYIDEKPYQGHYLSPRLSPELLTISDKGTGLKKLVKERAKERDLKFTRIPRYFTDWEETLEVFENWC